MRSRGHFDAKKGRGLARRRMGTTLIFTLIILAVSAMVLAGTVIVMGALVEHTAATQAAIARRQQIDNSRVLAVQFMRERVMSGTSPQIVGVTNSSVTSGGYTLGGIAIAGTGTSVWTGTVRPAGPNPFSSAGDTYSTVSGTSSYRSGYTASVAATLYGGGTNIAWNFEARTRTPTLGYDLANYASSGTVSSVTSAAAMSTTNTVYYGGTPLNIAFPPDIAQTGTTFAASVVASSTVAASGTFVVASSGTQISSEYVRANGTVTVYLDGSSSARTIAISGSLNQLIFSYGGTVTPGFVTGNPLRVVCSGLTTSSTISFWQGSFRPVYLIYNSTQPVTLYHTSTARLTGLFLNAPLTIQGGVIQGGFRTSGGSLSVSGGTLNILRETDPGLLDDVAIRRGWVESYRND